jgi:hypothetical protein
VVTLACGLLLTAAACSSDNTTSSGDSKERSFTDRSQSNFDTVQPPHLYDWSQARENLLAAQDAMAMGANSWTVQNTPGVGVTFQCASRGFPIPYSTQITAPTKGIGDFGSPGGGPTVTVPQQEPYGLYVPDNTSATFANCVLPDGKLGVFYSEPPLTSFLFDVNCDKNGCKIADHAKAVVTVKPVDPAKVCARPSTQLKCPTTHP